MTIEPTEEQKQAAYEFLMREFMPSESDIDALARLLAEREHKLRMEYQAPTQDVVIGKLRADLDAARARIAELEASEPNVLLQRAYLLACNERNEVREREAAHLQRIAELEEAVDAAAANAHWEGWKTIAELEESEAAHLAHIKALRRALEDRVDMGCDEVDALLGDTAHYDVEGAVAGIPVTDVEGGEG